MNGNDAAQCFMREALSLAHEAAQAGEVPVGAVIVHDGRVISAARNRTEERKENRSLRIGNEHNRRPTSESSSAGCDRDFERRVLRYFEGVFQTA